MTRILFTITQPFDPNAGGVQRSTFKMGKYFHENNFIVHYFSLASNGHKYVEFGTLHHANEEGGDKNKTNLEFLSQILNEFLPDIVINQMPSEKHLRETLSIQKKKLKFFLIGTLRNSLFAVNNNLDDFIDIKLRRIKIFTALFKNKVGRRIALKYYMSKRRRVIRKILDIHDKYVVLTPANIEEVKFYVGNYKSEKVTYITNSIPNIYENIQKRKKVILHVGRIDIAQKRSDLLLPFWKAVYPSLPDWEFHIIGNGSFYAELAKKIKDDSIPNIKLFGNQKPEDFYLNSSIFMMPSAFEGFPNTLIEAQSYGVVPIAFDSYPALRWIANHEIDSILVPAFNIEFMAEKTISLAKNSELLHQMSVASIENAKRFLIEKVGLQWQRLFKSFFDNNMNS